MVGLKLVMDTASEARLNSPDIFKIGPIITDISKQLNADGIDLRIRIKINAEGEIFFDGDEKEIEKLKIANSMWSEIKWDELKEHIKKHKLIPSRYRLYDEEVLWRLIKEKNGDETKWIVEKTINNETIRKVLPKQ